MRSVYLKAPGNGNTAHRAAPKLREHALGVLRSGQRKDVSVGNYPCLTRLNSFVLEYCSKIEMVLGAIGTGIDNIDNWASNTYHRVTTCVCVLQPLIVGHLRSLPVAWHDRSAGC